MKAILCHSFGPIENLTVEEIEAPNPGEEEVLIDVSSAGVNFPDLLLVKGLYQSRPNFPFSPGAEIAGTIVSTGPSVKELKKGDKVAAYLHYGGFAENVVIKESQCTKIRDGVPFDLAASFLVTYGTAFHALKDRARIKPGELLVVLGAAGGVGLAAVELGKKLGARVVACASTDEKLEICRAYGANHCINYATSDLKTSLKELAADQGVDVILDPVGGEYTEQAFRSLGYNGRYLVIGFTSGNIPSLPVNLPLLKIAALVGVFWGRWMRMFPDEAAMNHHQLMEWIASGELQPKIQKRFRLEETVQALQWLEDRKAMGKLVIEM
ncbi:MAG: NADPH:quinone oxidoreductase family protein [Saprospiraceae bacterium]|nr:NADPH:quinone oxidoreductase family protein [Saprospiraceae bacterium]